MLKLNVLLAKTQHAGAQFKKLITDYTSFFKNNQGAFRGVQKTYVPREGTMDEPSMRGNQLVVTTVDEKLQWLEQIGEQYIDNLMSVEATNASGNAKVPLVVGSVEFGIYSVPELMRLRGLLEKGDLEGMYSNLPVRSDAEYWEPATAEMYTGRSIFQGKKGEGVKKSMLKEQFIMPDPNLSGPVNSSRPYSPVLGTKDTIVELGDYTVQHFTGEATQRYKAEILARRSALLGAVKEAIENANETEVVPSAMTAKKLFGYLHTGKIA